MPDHRSAWLFALLWVSGLSLLPASGVVQAQDAPCVDFAEHPRVRHLLDVRSHAMAARSPVAYLARGDELTAVLYEHTSEPRILDRIAVAAWDHHAGRELVFAADDPDLLLLIDPIRLQTVDIADPRELRVRSTLEWRPESTEHVQREIRDAAVAAGRAYLVIWSHDAVQERQTVVLRLLDLTAPEPGQVLGELDLTHRDPDQLVLAGDHAYLRGDGLTVVDIRDAAAPVEVGHLETVPTWDSFDIADGHLYAVANDSTFNVHDLSDPTAPRLVGSAPIALFQYGGVRAPGGDLVLVWEPESVGIQLVDVSRPDAPVLGARVGDAGNDIHQPALAGDQLLIPTWSLGLWAADVSRHARQPRLDERRIVPGRTRYLLHGDHLLLPAEDRVLGYDLRDGAAPEPLVVQEDCSLAWPVIHGDLLAVGRDGAVHLVDVADVTAPTLLATLPWPEAEVDSGRLRFSGDVLHLDFHHLDRTYVIRTGDPVAPVMQGPIPRPRGETAILGDHLFTVGDTLTVHDISDPERPQLVGAVDLPDRCVEPLIARGHLYCTTYPEYDVLAFDLADPMAPVLVATLPSSFVVDDYCGHARQLRVAGDRLYLSSAGAGVRVIGIAEPGRPRHLGYLSGPANHMGTFAFAADQRRVCMGDPDGNLVIAPAPCAEQGDPDAPDEPGPADPPGEIPPVALVAVAPNPANPSARITFAMDHPGPVTVAVHDLAGRRLATLVDQSLPRGRHTVTWDGHDGRGRLAASGVYLVRVRAADHTDARKLSVIR